jgi:hypothetical protein
MPQPLIAARRDEEIKMAHVSGGKVNAKRFAGVLPISRLTELSHNGTNAILVVGKYNCHASFDLPPRGNDLQKVIRLGGF